MKFGDLRNKSEIPGECRKCGAIEGWTRSVGSIVQEIERTAWNQGAKEQPTCSKQKEG